MIGVFDVGWQALDKRSHLFVEKTRYQFSISIQYVISQVSGTCRLFTEFDFLQNILKHNSEKTHLFDGNVKILIMIQ